MIRAAEAAVPGSGACRPRPRRAQLAIVAAALAGCSPGGTGGGLPDAGASPNASILPAPLVTAAPDPFDAGGDAEASVLAADGAGRVTAPDAGPAPEAMRPDFALTAEAPGSKDAAGVSLEAAWRWRDLPAPPKAPEVAAEGLKEAHKLTGLTWKIELSDTGRMRAEFTSRALPLPAGSELRSRFDRYGTIVLWPNDTNYRVIAPGALRTVIGERRVDVTPLSSSAAAPQGEGRRLGVPTRKVELASSHGSVKLELAKVAEAGDGGPLLCRALVELVGIEPKTPACQPGEVALSAAYSWQTGGGILFEVTSLTRRTDLSGTDLLVPPPGSVWAAAGLPEAPSGIFLTRAELAAFRTGPLALPPRDAVAAPGEGFLAVNHTDTLLYLLVDGVPAVAVPPGAERYVIGPPRGRYSMQWRTFLGDRVIPPEIAELPARLVHGSADAGGPDGG